MKFHQIKFRQNKIFCQKKKKIGQKHKQIKVSSEKKRFGQNQKTICESLAKINFAYQNFCQKKRYFFLSIEVFI